MVLTHVMRMPHVAIPMAVIPVSVLVDGLVMESIAQVRWWVFNAFFNMYICKYCEETMNSCAL